MNVYDKALEELNKFVEWYHSCLYYKGENTFVFDYERIDHLESLLSNFENVAKCFYGFEHSNDFKNIVALCGKAVDKIKLFSQGTSRVPSAQYSAEFLPTLSSLVHLHKFIDTYLALDQESIPFIVLQHQSSMGVAYLVYYQDILSKTDKEYVTVLRCDKSTFFILPVFSKELKLKMQYLIGEDFSETKEVIFDNLKPGLNFYNLGAGPDNNFNYFSPTKMFENDRLNAIGMAFGFEPGVIKR